MKVLSKGPWETVGRHGVSRRRAINYEARFWEGPIEAGQSGRHYTARCTDTLYERMDGSFSFLNTAPSTSYYRELLRASK